MPVIGRLGLERHMAKQYLWPDRSVIKLNLQSSGNSVGLGHTERLYELITSLRSGNNGPVPRSFPQRVTAF